MKAIGIQELTHQHFRPGILALDLAPVKALSWTIAYIVVTQKQEINVELFSSVQFVTNIWEEILNRFNPPTI
jgi:hypothetical protein